MTTRILRLLLLAALAWPTWMPATAQETTVVNDDAVSNYRVPRMVRDLKELSKVKISQETLNDDNEAQTLAQSNAIVNNEKSLTKWKFKTRNVKHASASSHIKVVRNLAAIPEGYASITLVAGDVWGDGTGYQMLLDANATAYGSIIPATGALTTSGDVPASTYAEFEYKIPENADGALTTSNIILGGQQTILVPAGTYDWCITNPTPEDRMWIASEQGSVQGRYDNYVFEAGFSYVFTIVLNGENDDVSIDITNPDFNNPTNLTASDILDFETMLTWTAGGDETSWNVEYKKKADFDWISAGTATSANYLLTNLSMATEYQARVQSVYANGVSGWAITSFMTDNTAEGLCEPHDMGEISYTLSDSYGDGWNGASIQIVDAETNVVVTTLTISSGNSASGTVSLCYGRTVNFVWTAGSFANECSFTITDPDGEVIASKTANQTITNGSTFATYTMSMPTQTESLDFGTVDVGSSKTLTAKIMNENTADVQATLTATDPFSVVSSTVMLQPGLNAISVTFTPTEATNYHSTLKVATGGETSTVALKGTGNMSGPEAVRDEAFFEGITYTWTDSEGTHTSNLAEVATKPEQIIALLKEVYTNQDIPGNLKRGFTATGGTDTYSEVSYSGVGSISRASGGTYSYNDNLGWNISNKTAFKNTTSNKYTFTYMDPTDYRPNVEGVTLLLVESIDDYDLATYEWPSGTGYNYLKSMVETTIKSVRVVTQSKRTGEGSDRGTLFKIDCDKMNKFFLLGKGQLRWLMDSYWAENSSGTSQLQYTACPEPCYIYRSNSSYNGYHDSDGDIPLFSHMFEQFSPVNIDTGDNIDDLYQSLINMQSFGVYHDCISVPFAITSDDDMTKEHGHQFMMYGLDSEAADCQDVRDLMFFVPDYRMMKNDNRDNGNYQKFINYNTAHQPTMGLFVIRQNPITGEQTTYNGSDEYYKLHLTWKSNLLNFLPGEEGQYTLYRVTYDENGNKVYTAVGQFDPNTFEYDDYVPMQQNGQQVTYVVRGQDVEQFLTLQFSNEESFIIPGLDKAEQMRLALNSDFYYSRFYPQTVKNYYSNRLVVNNNIGTNIKASYLKPGTEFTFWRVPNGDVNAKVQFATVKVTSKSDGNGTLQIVPNSTAADYWDGTEYPYGYKALPASATFTYDASNPNSDVTFSGLEVYDNFWVSVANNDHPNNYGYYVALQTAVPFDMGDGTTSNAARSNTITVHVHKTAMTMNAISAQDVEDDVLHQLPATTTFNIDVKHSSKTEILRYDAYRWDSSYGTSAKPFAIINDAESTVDSEQDVAPNGEADNQDNEYTIKMDGENQTSIAIDPNDNVTIYQAPFIDNYVSSLGVADTYTYAPVVELFSPAGSGRTDYNTYGAPLQTSAAGVVEVEVVKPAASEYSWNADGKTYRYYNVYLKVNVLDIPVGYQVAKVRAWRKIDAQYLGEQAPTQNTPDYTGRLELDSNGEYMFVNKSDCQKNESLGDDNTTSTIKPGTFGAVALKQGEKIPMSFVVRVYFTKSQPADAPMLKAENNQPYYIMETIVEDELTNQIPTGINGVEFINNVASVKYYNAAGVESDRPFKGVNIVVTRYSDGSMSTTKIVK